MPKPDAKWKACPCVVLEGFLRPRERASLLSHVLNHADKFVSAGVASGKYKRGVVRKSVRRSSVLRNVGPTGRVIRRRVRSHISRVFRKLEIPELSITNVVLESVAACNDGDYFRKHTDSSPAVRRRRMVSYVYYFHRTPKCFCGGELLLYPTWYENGRLVFVNKPRVIMPKQNRIVFFPSSVVHEIRTVRCPSRELADSRFTVTGCFSR